MLEPRDALAIACTQPQRVEFWRPLGRLGLNTVATGPTHFYYQIESLESYRASTMKSTHSVCSGMIFIEIREGRRFQYEVEVF